MFLLKSENGETAWFFWAWSRKILGGNLFTNIFVDLVNVTLQSVHSSTYPETYTSCAKPKPKPKSKPDGAISIDSDGNIKE